MEKTPSLLIIEPGDVIKTDVGDYVAIKVKDKTPLDCSKCALYQTGLCGCLDCGHGYGDEITGYHIEFAEIKYKDYGKE